MDNIIPTKFAPTDNPNSNPLVNSPNELVSLPVKNIYDKYYIFPNIIKKIPILSLFILNFLSTLYSLKN